LAIVVVTVIGSIGREIYSRSRLQRGVAGAIGCFAVPSSLALALAQTPAEPVGER
jgi:hypothetical protein